MSYADLAPSLATTLPGLACAGLAFVRPASFTPMPCRERVVGDVESQLMMSMSPRMHRARTDSRHGTPRTRKERERSGAMSPRMHRARRATWTWKHAVCSQGTFWNHGGLVSRARWWSRRKRPWQWPTERSTRPSSCSQASGMLFMTATLDRLCVSCMSTLARARLHMMFHVRNGGVNARTHRMLDHVLTYLFRKDTWSRSSLATSPGTSIGGWPPCSKVSCMISQ